MTDSVEAVLSKFQLIQISKVRASQHQARKQFDEEKLKALADSIHAEGLLEPIVVRQVDDEFELVSGERRLRACKLNGDETIEAKIIQTVSEAEAAAKGLIENLQREDLNALEEAEGFQELLNMKDSHWTQEQIGKMVGKPQSRISESIRLLNLPEEIQANIRQRILTREHGIELLRIDNANSQKGMANKIVKGGWSVKQTREAIDKQLKGSSGSEAPQSNGQEAPASSATFKRKDGAIVISARFPGQFDLETVMSDLRSKLTPWLEKNPAPKE